MLYTRNARIASGMILFYFFIKKTATSPFNGNHGVVLVLIYGHK